MSAKALFQTVLGLAILLGAAKGEACTTLKTGDVLKKLRVLNGDGTIAERSYIVHIPAGGIPRGAPVVIALHGGGGDACSTRALSGLSAYADKTDNGLGSKFVVIYPNGAKDPRYTNTGRDGYHWNDGRDPEVQINDVGFLNKIIDQIKVDYPAVDNKRVMVIGNSNGGMMAMRMARDSAKVSMIVPISSLMPVKLIYPKFPDTSVRRAMRAVPSFHVVGTADRFITGQVTNTVGSTFDPEETYQELSRPLRNSGLVRQRYYDDRPYDLHPTGLIPYGDYKAQEFVRVRGRNAEQIILKNAGHCWYSPLNALADGKDALGFPCSTFDVADAALEIFKATPRLP